MDKKLTTTVGIALGVSLIAGAGFGIYKFLTKKSGAADGKGITAGGSRAGSLLSGFIGNSLVKSNSLYRATDDSSGLVGGGLAVASKRSAIA
jgi:hypothetical protein